jgi:hypothetical protein
MDMKKFKNPPSIMRPTPFWAINDRIDPEETARQMADMLSAGLGGGFFHSRHGLITDYMGKEWFAGMKSSLDAAKKKDGYLWLYDEDLWPSGNAGGQVAGIKDEYRATHLNAFLLAPGEPLPSAGTDETVRYGYEILERNRLVLTSFKAVTIDELKSDSIYERLVMVRKYVPKVAWWSGESYANLLNPEAMKKFMELTHSVYYRQLGDEFGRRIPGIFTDEPNVSSPKNGIPWYEGIPEKYRGWTGRDFWKDLPYLFFDGQDARHIRLLIHRAILRQFVEAYSRPIYEWCEKHNIAHTGHYLAEDTFASQITCLSGGVMAHYKYQQVPGIDHLCRQIDGYIPMLLTCKQVSSAARQLGRKKVLTEIFGVSRHTNTFEDFKWLGDYDLVLGVNFFCPHLTWYSAKGRRKRDYPPVWNYQQTYWKDLPSLNDYFSRTAYVLTSGNPDVPILILHSIESAIAGRRIGVNSGYRSKDIPEEDMKEADILDSLMRKILDVVLNTGYDADLGDEGFIADYGTVRGKSFVVGRMSYKIVVVPPSVTWREKTVKLLERFVKNGGILIILGKLPEEIEGLKEKKRWQDILLHKNVYSLPSSVESIQNAVKTLLTASYTLEGADGRFFPKTYVQHRIDGKDEFFFIVNSDKSDTRDYTLTIKNPREKRLLKLDSVNGKVFRTEAKKSSGSLTYKFPLSPAGSILLMLSSSTDSRAKKEKIVPDFRNAEILHLPDVFRFERKDENVLVLDRISVSYDGSSFEREEPEWRVRKKVAEHFGTESALQWQPWVAVRKGLFEGKGGDIILRYKFSSKVKRPESYLVIEDMQKGKVFVNGREITWDDEGQLGWHWDRSFRKVEITELVTVGENIVDFKVHYDFLTEIEPSYIIGDFGVKMADPYRGEIVKEKKNINAGLLVSQGYPFYSGRMVYKTEFNAKGSDKKTFLKILNPSGVLFKISVNGMDLGKILWSPYILEITPALKKGKNKVDVEVVTSLQNSWGPLHERDGDDNTWAGPNAFEDEDVIRNEFSLFNYGIKGIEILAV